MTLKFKAYSATNRDFGEVYSRDQRFRGGKKGEPMIVAGYNIRHAEENLKVIREAFRFLPNATITENKRGSFTVEIKEDDDKT